MTSDLEVFCTLLAAAGLVAAIAVPSGLPELAALGIATVGIYATLGPFWGLPPITSTAAAGGIALINSVGNLGGFLGPSIVGWTLELTHSFHAGLAVIAACLGLSVVAVLLVGYRIRGPARRRRRHTFLTAMRRERRQVAPFPGRCKRPISRKLLKKTPGQDTSHERPCDPAHAPALSP